MRHYSRPLRSGFTMLELLIVIMVIAILMALTVSAAFSFIVNAREAATATTISKVNELVQDRVRSFRQFDFSDAGLRLQDAWNAAYSSDKVMTHELGEVLVRKSRFKQAFPQSFAEADRTRLFPASLFPNLTFAASAPYDSTFPSTYQSKYECGIVLYAMLSRSETFGAPSTSEDAFTGSEIRVGPETNNLPCLVDAWGEPLRFYRWPTRLIRCGEQDFDGSGASDDFNGNGSQDLGGVTATTSGSNSILAVGAAIRPYPTFPGPTPASLLISNLPPYDRTSFYAVGADVKPGVVGVDDDNAYGIDDPGEKGWPESDDPEPLNTDPDDPTFRLTTWFNDSLVSAAVLTDRRNRFIAPVSGSTDYLHDFYTFHTPLIVSAGPDKLLGLYEPTDTANFGHLAAPLPSEPAPKNYYTSTMRYLMDNITNLNRRTGGK